MTPSNPTSHATVTLGTSRSAWTVNVTLDGKPVALTIFQTEDEAKKYADSERRRLGVN